MLICGVILLLILVGFVGVSFAHHRKVRKFLLKTISVDQKTLDIAQKYIGVESITGVSITLFDVLYNTSRLDPYALRGINHLHHAQEFSDISDLISFMKGNIIKAEQGTTEWKQIIDKYKGYTGEEQSFEKLRSLNQNINIPESGTNPNIDVFIDNQGFDVAVTDDKNYIMRKLSQDPDKMILTNREMAQHFAGNDRVMIDQDLSVETAFDMTNNTFEGMTDMGTYMDSIPLITLVLSGVKNTAGVYKGRKDVAIALEHTALDTTGVGLGSLAGGKLGLVIGLGLAPATGGASAIIIPTVSTLIGSIIGIISGKSVTNWFKERKLRKAVDTLISKASAYQEKFLSKYNDIIKRVRDYYNGQKTKTIEIRNQLQGWFLRTFFPSPLVKFYSLAAKKIIDERQKAIEFYRELKTVLAKYGPQKGGLVLFAQGDSILLGDKELVEAYREVSIARRQVEIEKNKLK